MNLAIAYPTWNSPMTAYGSLAIESGSQNACAPDDEPAPTHLRLVAHEPEPESLEADWFDAMQEEADQVRVRSKPRHARAQRADRIR